MRKLARSLTLAIMLATTCGAIAYADIPTGTDPVPPPTQRQTSTTTTSTTVATVLEVFTGMVL
jgi:hypothetical protein